MGTDLSTEAPQDSSENKNNQIVSKEQIKEYFKTPFPITLSNEIFTLAPTLTNWRRFFHKNAELKFNEKITAKSISKILNTLKLEVKENIAQTGVTGLLKGAYDGPCILLRADMDALPITEKPSTYNEKFISQNKGVMHACGHDAHMSIMLGTATVLSRLRHLLHGSVKFCFQPGEEGGAGAKKMIEEGVLDNPKVDQVYGLHVWSYDKLGSVRVLNNELMAGAMIFEITITGKGGHSATPHKCNDAVLASAYLIQQLHTIVAKDVNALQKAVLSIGSCKSNNNMQHNVICSCCVIEGTIRWFRHDTYNTIIKRVRQIMQGVELSFDVKVAFKEKGEAYPPVINTDAKCVECVRKCVKEVLPNCDVFRGKATMAGEDFSFFLNKKPGCFFFSWMCC